MTTVHIALIIQRANINSTLLLCYFLIMSCIVFIYGAAAAALLRLLPCGSARCVPADIIYENKHSIIMVFLCLISPPLLLERGASSISSSLFFASFCIVLHYQACSESKRAETNMSSVLIMEIENKIAHYSDQIASFPSDGSARAKKRIYQKLGKLKKDLISAKEGKPILKSEECDDFQSINNNSNNAKKRLHESDDENFKVAPPPATHSKDKTHKKLKREMPHVSSNVFETTVEEKVGKLDVETASIPLPQSAKSVLSKKESKNLLHSLNHELVDCAIKKQLSRAKKSFRSNEAKGLVMDVLAYTNFINVYVRCNDVVGAASILQEMHDKGIQANTITYTTMLKGYCEIGSIKEASDLFLQRMIPTAYWNIRSLSTFLRGCIRTGAVDVALLAFNTCYREQSIKVTTEEFADESACLEGIVGLLCRANRVTEATSLVMDYISGAMNRQQVDIDDGTTDLVLRNAGLYSILAKANVLIGLFSEAKKYISLAMNLIEEGDKATLRENMRKRFLHSLEISKVGSGDANPESYTNNSFSSSMVAPSKSVELFLAHKRNDLRNQIELIEEYMSAVQTIPTMKAIVSNSSSSSSFAMNNLSNDDCLVIEACRINAIALSQLLYFGFDGKSDVEKLANDDDHDQSTTNMADYLISAIKSKYGLDRLQPAVFSNSLALVTSPGTENSSNSQRLSNEIKEYIDARVNTMRLETINRIQTLFNARSGKIDFAKLFPDCIFAKAPVSSRSTQKTNQEGEKNKREKRKFSKTKGSSATVINSSSINGSGSGHMTGTMPKEYRKLLNLGMEEISSDEGSDEGSDLSDESDIENMGDGEKKSREIPIKLEIGSGNGDWIVAQAAADRIVESSSHNAEKSITVRGNWIACELRNDRAHHIWSNHFLTARHLISSPQSEHYDVSTAMKGGNNLAVLAGDASKIVKNFIEKETVSSIFINYPQPPERVAGDHKNQGKHLLTHEFFCDMMGILKKKGTITILTDNLLYAQSLAQTIATMNKTALHSRKKISQQSCGTSTPSSSVTILQSVDLEESEIERRVVQEYVPFMERNGDSEPAMKQNKKEKSDRSAGKIGSYKDSVIVWRGDPGDESGHIAMVSSYFDRMWSLGQKKRRWFLYLRKKQM